MFDNNDIEFDKRLNILNLKIKTETSLLGNRYVTINNMCLRYTQRQYTFLILYHVYNYYL